MTTVTKDEAINNLLSDLKWYRGMVRYLNGKDEDAKALRYSRLASYAVLDLNLLGYNGPEVQ